MSPVDFLMPLTDQTVDEIPGTAVFECEISRDDIRPEWRKADVVLGPSDKYEMKSEGGRHKLIIHEVDGNDQSDYSAIFRDFPTTAKLHVKGSFKKHVQIAPSEYCNPHCFLNHDMNSEKELLS